MNEDDLRAQQEAMIELIATMQELNKTLGGTQTRINRTGQAMGDMGARAGQVNEAWRKAREEEAAIEQDYQRNKRAAQRDFVNTLDNLGTALLDTQRNYQKYNQALKSAGDAALHFGMMLGPYGTIAGLIVKGATKIAEKFTEQADNVLKATDSLNKFGTAGSFTTAQVLDMGHAAGLVSKNLDLMVKPIQSMSSAMISLGATSGDGIKEFSKMVAVTKEERMAFQRLGLSQGELIQAQADYVKLQYQSGAAITDQMKRGDGLKKASLEYTENLLKLSALTGKNIDEQKKEQEAARAGYQYAFMQRKLDLDIKRETAAGNKDRVAELRAQKVAFDKILDATQRIDPSKVKAMQQYLATGILTQQSATAFMQMGVDPAQYRAAAQRTKTTEEAEDLANDFANKLKEGTDKVVQAIPTLALDEQAGARFGITEQGLRTAGARQGVDEVEAGRTARAQIARGKAEGTDAAKDLRAVLTETEIAVGQTADKLLAANNPLIKGFEDTTKAAEALAAAAGIAAAALIAMAGVSALGTLRDAAGILKRGKGYRVPPGGGSGPGVGTPERPAYARPTGAAQTDVQRAAELRQANPEMTRQQALAQARSEGGFARMEQQAQTIQQEARAAQAARTAAEAAESASKLGKIAKIGGGVVGTAVTVGAAGYEGYQDVSRINQEEREGKLTKAEATQQKGEAVGKATGAAAGGAGGAWAGGTAGASAGAAIGALFGGVGAAPGAVIGGLIGAGLGAWGGSEAGGWFGKKVGGKIGEGLADSKAVDKVEEKFIKQRRLVDQQFTQANANIDKRIEEANNTLVGSQLETRLSELEALREEAKKARDAAIKDIKQTEDKEKGKKEEPKPVQAREPQSDEEKKALASLQAAEAALKQQQQAAGISSGASANIKSPALVEAEKAFKQAQDTLQQVQNKPAPVGNTGVDRVVNEQGGWLQKMAGWFGIGKPVGQPLQAPSDKVPLPSTSTAPVAATPVAAAASKPNVEEPSKPVAKVKTDAQNTLDWAYSVFIGKATMSQVPKPYMDEVGKILTNPPANWATPPVKVSEAKPKTQDRLVETEVQAPVASTSTTATKTTTQATTVTGKGAKTPTAPKEESGFLATMASVFGIQTPAKLAADRAAREEEKKSSEQRAEMTYTVFGRNLDSFNKSMAGINVNLTKFDDLVKEFLGEGTPVASSEQKSGGMTSEEKLQALTAGMFADIRNLQNRIRMINMGPEGAAASGSTPSAPSTPAAGGGGGAAASSAPVAKSVAPRGATAPAMPEPHGASESPATGGGGDNAPKLARVTSKTGKSAMVNAEHSERFQKLINYLDSVGYNIYSLGGYVDRDVRGRPGVKSVHAKGGAIDINPAENPMGSKLITDFPSEISQIADSLGLGWGGEWTSVKDAMHFSVAKHEGGVAKLSDGGVAVGPTTGYPVELHGKELVQPLDANSILEKLATTPASAAVPETSTASIEKSIAPISEPLRNLTSINASMLDVLSSKLDVMISKLDNSNNIQDKILRQSSM